MRNSWTRNVLLKCLNLGAAVLVTTVLVSCATPQSVNDVQVGMTKGEVLEIVGNPKRTGRQHGQDRWTYFSGNEEIFVFFSDGKVTYVGPATPAQPKKSDSSGFKSLDTQ